MGMAGIYLEKMSPPSRFRERCIYGHVVRPLLTNNIGMLRSYTICSTPVFLLYFLIMKNLQSRAAEKIAERLSWCTAKRDQAGIAEGLAAGKDIPEVYGLGEAGLFDEFFYFLDEHGITDLFGLLEPKIRERDSNVSFSAALLIYVMRITAGLSFFWHILPVILQSQALMRLIGFNGRGGGERHAPPGMRRTKTKHAK